MQTELLASLVEVVDHWGRQLSVLLGADAKKLSAQIEIPRPGAKPKTRVKNDPAKIAAFFGRLGKKKGGG